MNAIQRMVQCGGSIMQERRMLFCPWREGDVFWGGSTMGAKAVHERGLLYTVFPDHHYYIIGSCRIFDLISRQLLSLMRVLRPRAGRVGTSKSRPFAAFCFCVAESWACRSVSVSKRFWKVRINLPVFNFYIFC